MVRKCSAGSSGVGSRGPRVSQQWRLILGTEPNAGLPGEAPGCVQSHRGHGGTGEGVRRKYLLWECQLANTSWPEGQILPGPQVWVGNWETQVRLHANSFSAHSLHPCKVLKLLIFLKGINPSLSASSVLIVGRINYFIK